MAGKVFNYNLRHAQIRPKRAEPENIYYVDSTHESHSNNTEMQLPKYFFHNRGTDQML